MITEKAVTSEPVPAVVGIAISGMISPGTLSAPSYSVILPPYFATTPTAFATSMGEPPPSATIKSAPLTLNASAARSTVSTDGFPSVSQKVLTAMPACVRISSHCPTTPSLFSVGPEMIKPCFPPSFPAAPGSSFNTPSPKRIFCGTENVNLFMLSPPLISKVLLPFLR